MMGHEEAQARTERFRRHLRRPHAGRRKPLTMNTRNTVHRIRPKLRAGVTAVRRDAEVLVLVS